MYALVKHIIPVPAKLYTLPYTCMHAGYVSAMDWNEWVYDGLMTPLWVVQQYSLLNNFIQALMCVAIILAIIVTTE